MNTTLAHLMRAMINYDNGDVPRIQHFVKVHNFAATIGVSEGIDDATLFILEAAAILHDIGIHPAEAKYGSSMGKYQDHVTMVMKNVAAMVHTLCREEKIYVSFCLSHPSKYVMTAKM